MSEEKITNANSFPKDWPIKKLADIGSTYGGLTNKSKEDFTEGNSKFITYKNIYNNTFINTNELESVRIDKDEKQNKVKYGDVFFTGSSETPDEVGISSVLLEEVDDVYLNSFCFGFRFNDLKKTIPEFYGYYFRGPVFRNEVYPLAQGSTRFNLSKSEMVKLKVPVPPVKEQRKIAAILSSVDKAIEKTEAIIEQTEKVKKGLMQQLLTKGIGHTKFKKTEIGEIPEEWEVRRLDDIFEFYGGMPFSRSVLGDEGAFYLHYGDIHKMNKSAFDTSIDSSWLPRLDISKEEIREYSLLKTGDIVFADASEDTEGIGKSVVIINDDNKPFISGLHTIIAREKEVTLDDRYKEYCFSNPLVKKQFIRIATGATVYGISKTNIKQIKIPVPPIEEQRTIAKALKGLDNKIRNEKEKLEPLINIKKGLMQALLTGKVRVKVDDEVMSQ